MHNESHTGCLKLAMNESINTICALLNEDRRLTLRELETIVSDDLGEPFSRMAISRIVMEKLGFCKVCARWVPNQLSPVHNTNRMAAALDFLEQYERDGE